MPAQLADNKSSFNKGTESTQTNTRQLGKSMAAYSSSFYVSYKSTKQKELCERMVCENQHLKEFFLELLRKKLTLTEALVGTVAKLNIIINTIQEYAELREISHGPSYMTALNNSLTTFYGECKKFEYNKVTLDMEKHTYAMWKVLNDMEKDIKQLNNSTYHRGFQDYLSLVITFFEDGIIQIEQLAPPHPDAVNHLEILKQENYKRVEQQIFGR